MDDRSEGSLIEMDLARRQKLDEPLRRRVTVDILPEDVLLLIFDHYMAKVDEYRNYYEIWQTLVHVCQKWRYVVFQSPLRLNLRILCSTRRPVREKLAVWPSLPIIIDDVGPSISKCSEDNIFVALEHTDRVCTISLAIRSPLLERVLAAMQKTFVALKDLYLNAWDDIDDRALVVSDSFLGGSAPHLRRLCLIRIQFPFPVLRKLPLSAPYLVDLELSYIPHSGYISPERMVTCLSALTGLKHFCVGFESPRSHPPQEGRHPPPTRFVLHALTKLMFIGVSEYLEDLVTRIDAPLLNELDVTFFHQLIFDTPQLIQFISRTPKLKAYDIAHVNFSSSRATIVLQGRDNTMKLGISCRHSDWQLSSLVGVITSSFPSPRALISTVESLILSILEVEPLQPHWQDDIECDQWFELFHIFTTVKDLYLSRPENTLPHIMPTLQELVGERVTEVLPNLQSILLEDRQGSEFVPEAMQRFVAARQLSSCPIAISHWNW